MSSSSPAVLDPLAAPQESFPNVGVSVVTVPRRERIAPDVTAIGGAEAVTLVRAAGFIAAIESVTSELAEGTVIEQDPTAGEQLQREAVITLRLAAPPLDPVQLANEHETGLASEQVERSAAPDDTEEWFQALAPGRPDPPASATSGKRRRKHRPAKPSARERLFDPPRAPSVRPRELPPTVPLSQRARERASALAALGSSAYAFAPLVTLQWRRASALLAGVLLLALLGTRLLASSDRRARPALPRAIAPTTDARLPARGPVSAVPGRRPPRGPRAGRHRTPNRARAHEQDGNSVARVAARPADQPEPSAPPATAPAPSAGGQFAYLGQ